MTTPKKDKLPPHSDEAEEGVLGCILLEPMHCMAICAEKLKHSADVFYDMRNRKIFDAMLHIYAEQRPPNLMLVAQRIRDRGEIEEIGGMGRLASLADETPTAVNLEYYLEIIVEKFVRRSYVIAAREITELAMEDDGEIKETMDYAEAKILSVSRLRTHTGAIPVAELISRSLEQVDYMIQHPGRIPGVESGFKPFDDATCGFLPGDMSIIGARPSVGKTSLAMNIAEHLSVDKKIPVGVISLEMKAQMLINRMMCSRAKVSLFRMMRGYMNGDEMKRITSSAVAIKNAELYIDDERGQTLLQVRSKIRRMVQEHGVKIVFLDYLQLLTTGKRNSSRAHEVGEVSNGLKNIAGELNIPMVVLSQLNRDIDRDKPRPPTLADLKESGDIEQDADLVMLMWVPNPDQIDQCGTVIVNNIIAKQRNGPWTRFDLQFVKPHTRFQIPPSPTPEEPDPFDKD